MNAYGGQTPPADPNWEYTKEVREEEVRQKRWGKAPRGCELFLVDDDVVAFNRLLYSPKEFWTGRYFAGNFLQAGPKETLIRAVDSRIVRLAPNDAGAEPKPLWSFTGVAQPRAMAVGANAVVVAGRSVPSAESSTDTKLTALSLENGSMLWSQSLPAAPAWWGLATDRAGRIVATLQDGSVLCLISTD